jgi:hypothetical protein
VRASSCRCRSCTSNPFSICSEAAMKIEIESEYYGGIYMDDELPEGPMAEHTIVDADTGRRLVERSFGYIVEAELYLAAQRKNIEARASEE